MTERSRAQGPTGEHLPWGTLTTRDDGRIVEVSERFASWTGHSRNALVDRLRFTELLSPASRILHETHYTPLLRMQGYTSEVAFDLARPDRSRFAILVSAVRSSGGPDAEAETSLTVFDATETRRHERALIEARRQAEDASQALERSNAALVAQKEELRVTLRSIADAVVTVDANGSITSMNPAAEQLTGTVECQQVGLPLLSIGDLLDEDTSRPVDFGAWPRPAGRIESRRLVLRRRDGVVRHIAWSAAPIREADGAFAGTVVVCRDITDERAAIRQLQFDASHDHLTGLFNRREFERRFALSCKQEDDDRTEHVLCHVNLDQFKIVNDSAGHVAGDRLLVEVAELLANGMRQTDTLARLGGDEFGVLLTACPFDSGLRIAEELRKCLAAFRFAWAGRVYAVTASIGVSVFQPGDPRAVEALTDASIACNAAKESGRNRVHGMRPDDAELRSRRGEMGLISRVRSALDDDRFELHFQPIVRIAADAGRIDHGEILLRLREGAGDLVPPGEFITAAERFHQMQPVDRWVLDRTLGWLGTVDGIRVSINLSGQSFGDPAFLAFVVDRMQAHGIAPTRVCFEITETAAIADRVAALCFIETLRPLGVRFALDDFGAGLSSFNYLKTLPVDVVKIDGSFVKAMTTDPVSRAIVESIHRIARLCDLETVAEWVEDASTLRALRAIGIEHAQGWGVGKPIPIGQVAALFCSCTAPDPEVAPAAAWGREALLVRGVAA